MDDSWIKRVKAQMRIQDATQETLAEALDCTRGAVGHYLTGRRTPSMQQFENIAKALNADLLWLMHGNSYAGIKESSNEYRVKKGYLLPVSGDTRTGRKKKPSAFLSVPTPAHKCYALYVESGEYAPRVYEDEILMVDPGAELYAGDEVLIHYKNKQVKLHTYINTKKESVTVDSIVGEKDRRSVKNRNIRSIEKIIAIFRSSELVE